MRACSLLSSTRSLSPCASVVRVSRSWRDARPAHGSRRGERVMIVPPVPPPRAPNGVLRACWPGRRRLLSSETRCAVRADRVSRVHEDISPREREGGRLREKERESETRRGGAERVYLVRLSPSLIHSLYHRDRHAFKVVYSSRLARSIRSRCFLSFSPSLRTCQLSSAQLSVRRRHGRRLVPERASARTQPSADDLRAGEITR